MSDEPRPLSLRLKPRAAPQEEASPAPAVSAPPPTPTPAPEATAVPEPMPEGSETLRLRLRPRTPPPEGLSVETPLPFSGTAAPEPAPSAPEVNETSGAEAPLAVDPEPPSVEPSALEASASEPAAPETISESVPDAAPEPMQAEPEPVALPPVEPVLNVPLPAPVPPVGTAPAATPVLPPPTPPPTIRADKWLVAVVVLVAVMAGAFLGFRYLFKTHPKTPAVGRVQVAASSGKDTPAETVAANPKPRLVDNPQSDAGKLVARARDAVAAHDRQGADMDAVLDAQTASAPAKPVAPRAAAAPAASAERPAPEPEAAPAKPEPPPPPSQAFRDFVTKLKISGVFQGENARAMLNGKTYSMGDVVEPKLKITFVKVDPQAKLLTFQEESGATLTKRY